MALPQGLTPGAAAGGAEPGMGLLQPRRLQCEPAGALRRRRRLLPVALPHREARCSTARTE